MIESVILQELPEHLGILHVLLEILMVLYELLAHLAILHGL